MIVVECVLILLWENRGKGDRVFGGEDSGLKGKKLT